jgi:hypothetical protein
MIEPRKKDIGRRVRYAGNGNSEARAAREGVITGFDLHHVHVRYHAQATSKGNRREELEWADGPFKACM